MKVDLQLALDYAIRDAEIEKSKVNNKIPPLTYGYEIEGKKDPYDNYMSTHFKSNIVSIPYIIHFHVAIKHILFRRQYITKHPYLLFLIHILPLVETN